MFEWLLNRIRLDNVTIGGSYTGRDSTTNNFGPSVSAFEDNIARKVTLEYKNLELEELSEKLHKELQSLSKTNERVSSENLVNKMRVAGDFDRAWSVYNAYINNGFSGNSYIYNVLIMLAEKYSDATRVLFEMKKYSVQPNEYILSLVINKADSYADALNVYESLKKQGVCDNAYVYNALINKTENEEQAKQVYSMAIKYNLVNEYILFSMLKKIYSYEKSKDLFESAKDMGVPVNNYIYSIILSKSMAFLDAVDFYRKNVANNSSPNEYVYSALAGKAKSKEEIDLFINLIGSKKIGSSTHVFEPLIRNSTNIDEAFSYYEKLLLSGSQPDKHIYTALISKYESLNEAFKTLDLMAENEVEIDSHVIHSVIKSTSTNEDIDKVLDKSDYIGVHLDAHVYTEAIKRSSTSDFAKEIYRRGLIHGITFDPHLYTCLISKMETFEDAKSIYKDTLINQIFDDWIVSSLMSKAKENYQVEWVLNNIEKYNGENRTIFPYRYSSIRNGISCIENIMRAGQYRPDSKDLSKLYSSPIDHGLTSEEVLSFSWRNKLSSFSLNAFVKRISKIDIYKSLKILLHYPHLTSGIPIYKQWKDESIEFFYKNLSDEKYLGDANIALATCYYVNEGYSFALDSLSNISEADLKAYPDNKRDGIYELVSKCETLQLEKANNPLHKDKITR